MSDMSREHKEYLKKIKINKNNIFITQLLIFILFFLLWEFAANYKLIDSFIFSKPTAIIKITLKMILEGSFFKHIWITFYETIVGFVLSIVIGIILSIILWWNKFLRDVLDPYLVVLNSLPKTALAPIIIVIFGTNIKSVIITSFLTSVIVTVISILGGFIEIDKEKIKLIKTFGGTKLQILSKVVLPGSVPTILSCLKINIGLSFVGVIVGEFLVAQAGLGYLIVYGSQIFRMDMVMMSIIVLCILAAVMYKALSLPEKYLKKRNFK